MVNPYNPSPHMRELYDEMLELEKREVLLHRVFWTCAALGITWFFAVGWLDQTIANPIFRWSSYLIAGAWALSGVAWLSNYFSRRDKDRQIRYWAEIEDGSSVERLFQDIKATLGAMPHTEQVAALRAMTDDLEKAVDGILPRRGTIRI